MWFSEIVEKENFFLSCRVCTCNKYFSNFQKYREITEIYLMFVVNVNQKIIFLHLKFTMLNSTPHNFYYT